MADSCQFGIKLTKTVTDDTTVDVSKGIYITIQAAVPVNLADAAIFVYSREPQVPETGKWNSHFEAVAAPNDLEELNVGEPLDSDTATTKFRLDYIKAYFRSRQELETAWIDIQADVAFLLKSLETRCENLADPVSTVYSLISPTTTDSACNGYTVGNLWQNLTTGVQYVCVSDTDEAAIWAITSEDAHYASFDPTVNDGTARGFRTGSRWINTATPKTWVCRDATQGAAAWITV